MLLFSFPLLLPLHGCTHPGASSSSAWDGADGTSSRRESAAGAGTSSAAASPRSSAGGGGVPHPWAEQQPYATPMQRVRRRVTWELRQLA